MIDDVTPGWCLVSIAVEGADVSTKGVMLWNHVSAWRPMGDDPIIVAHPSFPAQRHPMRVYELDLPGTTIRFAAGEFSNGVWGFYAPK